MSIISYRYDPDGYEIADYHGESGDLEPVPEEPMATDFTILRADGSRVSALDLELAAARLGDQVRRDRDDQGRMMLTAYGGTPTRAPMDRVQRRFNLDA